MANGNPYVLTREEAIAYAKALRATAAKYRELGDINRAEQVEWIASNYEREEPTEEKALRPC